MNAGWNYRREHLRLQQRSHYVITDGGDQPNVVPSKATVWYFFRETEYPRIKELWEIGDKMAQGASLMTGDDVDVADRRYRLAAAFQQAGGRGDVHEHPARWDCRSGPKTIRRLPRRFRRRSSRPCRAVSTWSWPSWTSRSRTRTSAAVAQTTSATCRGPSPPSRCATRRTFQVCRDTTGRMPLRWPRRLRTKASSQVRKSRP